ncbi:hypothetical protein E5I20_09020 [Campylobacter coli]|uniref:Uncharacterized protein n=1 Tax=Campylobacter taeniopygiae TaxID=2510188 RepID=A0ABY2TGH7_9BACT|nr:hypothetical protein [Campylobacter coli]EAK2109062.1 hypothetical protein [Campylobacter jejuni]TKX32695.1 hypothetical protein CQA75_08925 [Campylobacter taeniopygiae]EAK0103830.1 hypothetical protein [Campylobacter coli]EAL7061349.1 hypothetical protein [Campylobacter jejuni]
MKNIDNTLKAKIIFLKHFKIIFKAFLTFGFFVAFLISFMSDDFLTSFFNISSFFALFALNLFIITFIYVFFKARNH